MSAPLSLAAAASSDVPSTGGLFLFDFDGVVCDSCDECTVSAWRTCKILNAIEGEDVDKSADAPPKWLFDKMREIRPAIEIGWQIPVLLSVFLEQQKEEKESGTPAMSVDDIISNYEGLVSNWLDKRGLAGENMVKTFGGVRDDWMADDLNSWLDINAFYGGISNGISSCTGEAVLVTTKQQRFATALVRHAGVNDDALPEERIYGLGQYKSKSDVIVDRMQKGGYAPDRTHFFEDRWPTLAKCLKDERLEGVRFYLCSWGYCTKGELELAESESRVEVLGLEDFGKIVAT